MAGRWVFVVHKLSKFKHSVVARRLSSVPSLDVKSQQEFVPPSDWSTDQHTAWGILKKLAQRIRPSIPFASEDLLSAHEYTASKLVFTGREQELAAIKEEARLALKFAEDHPCFTVVQGGSGSGKSRLLRECPFRLREVHKVEAGVLSLLLDFNGGGDSVKLSSSILRKYSVSGEAFLAMSILFRSFLGSGLSELSTKLSEEDIQHLQVLTFKEAVRMLMWSHRTRHSLSQDTLLLFCLLMDEPQLIYPSLADSMSDREAHKFTWTLFEAMYEYKKSKSKEENCALLPVCAGTLVPELDWGPEIKLAQCPEVGYRGCSFSTWGKRTVSLSGLGEECSIQLLEKSLPREYAELLKSKPLLEILRHVSYLPRFLQDIYTGILEESHLVGYIKVGDFAWVATALRNFLEKRIHVRFGRLTQKLGDEWSFVIAACLTRIPVPLGQLQVTTASLKGYVYPEMVSQTRCILSLPFVILQMFKHELGLKRLLGFHPEDPKGSMLEDCLDEIMWKRMEVFLALGLKEIRLGELLVGAEGPSEVLDITIPLPISPRVEKDANQFLDRAGSVKSFMKVVGKLFRTTSGTFKVDHRIYISDDTIILFQVKGVKDGVSLVASKAKDSLYSACLKLDLHRKERSKWVMVFVPSGPIHQGPGDLEKFRAMFPRVLLLNGEGLKKFLPTIITEIFKREP